MSDILLHFEWHTQEQARADLKDRVLPWIGQQLEAHRSLSGDISEYEASITDQQRAYFHRVVLQEIAQFAPGEKYHWKIWKEHFRKEWLGFKTVASVNPLTGKKSRHRVRISTEDLGIRKYAEYIERVIAFASTDLGVTVSEPLPPHLRGTRAKQIKNETVDQETGEILEHACST